jgi:hypothetical protein
VEADAVYSSPLVTQVINKVMLDGKKSIAEQIVWRARAGGHEDRPAAGRGGAGREAVTPVLKCAPPRRRRRPGSGRIAAAPGPHARRALARHVRARSPRKGMSNKLANRF